MSDAHPPHSTSPHAPIGVRELIGETSAVAQLRNTALRVARSAVPVLITGETGTGKEVLARFIHASSPRADRPFLAINCAALPSALVEAELFGYEKGAFTGAFQRKAGVFEDAHTGTLFLDEVTEFEPHLQAKLLRVLQEQEVRRVGATRPQKVDVRIIAASSRDLHLALASGALRADLFYRLRIIGLDLPPLRERVADIRPLCEHFLERHAALTVRPVTSISPEALAHLQAYAWPGNIRELENVIQRAMVLRPDDGGDALLREDLVAEASSVGALPGTYEDSDQGFDLATAVRHLKQNYVRRALARAGGNRTQAAQLLGVSRRGLYHLLLEFDIAARDDDG